MVVSLRPLLGLFLCLGLLVYLPGLHGPLLLDDKPALTENELVRIDGRVLDEWRSASLSSNSGPLRRPLAMLSFAGNHALTGDFSSPWTKATNLAIHFAIGGLLYWVFLGVLGGLGVMPDNNTRRLVALTATTIWLLHPLNVSTVLYAVQRMAQLAALFTVAGLLVFIRYRQRWAEAGAGVGEVLAASLWLLLLTGLAALAKENGALLPLLLVVLEVVVFRGVWAGRANPGLRLAGWLLLVAPIVLVVVLCVFSPALLLQGYASRDFTLEERLFTQARLLWRYLGWICMPNINDMGFHHDDIPLSTGLIAPTTTVLALISWSVLLIAALLQRQRWPLLLLAVLFFLVGHSLESTVIPLEMVYEHRNYLPGTMVCLALAYLVVVPATRSHRVNVVYPLAGVLSVLCLLLFVRVQTWSDEVQLGRVNLANHPESARANHLYANALLRRIRDDGHYQFSESEKNEMLLLARHYYERMHQADEGDVAALVLLAYLDSAHFPQLQGQVDWLTLLYEVLLTRKLQSSDWNALGLLFDLSRSNAELADQKQLAGILDVMAERFPNSADVQRFRYHYLARDGASSSVQLLPLLQQARQQAPGASWVYHLLLREQARSGDIPGMYESARLWLLNDPNRHHIHELKGLFEGVASPAEEADG
ncbi:MAG: hypothetical protein H6991_09385 [Pseudomonadales bacterium]|nr:hypothetical protein [Pseudomonadales bacterium]